LVASFNVQYGLAVHRPQPAVKLIMAPARQQGKTWAMKLNEAIRKGIMKSAWDGVEDPFGPDADTISPQEDHWRRQKEREEANRRQDELNARLAAERHEQALDELQDVEGFGSF
jgi:hypothetical protein